MAMCPSFLTASEQAVLGSHGKVDRNVRMSLSGWSTGSLLTALAEDQCSLLTTHIGQLTATYNSSFRAS